MPQIRKSILVAHTSAEMFELVDRVEHYPEFLPWCASSTVHQRDEHTTAATLGIDYLGLKTSFTTENRKTATEIVMLLRDGPFKSLNGAWRFKSLSAEACKVEFDLDYEFSSWALETMIGPVFSVIATTFVDAFVRQADKVCSSN